MSLCQLLDRTRGTSIFRGHTFDLMPKTSRYVNSSSISAIPAAAEAFCASRPCLSSASSSGPPRKPESERVDFQVYVDLVRAEDLIYTFQLDELPDLISNTGIQPLLLCHFSPHFRPR